MEHFFANAVRALAADDALGRVDYMPARIRDLALETRSTLGGADEAMRPADEEHLVEAVRMSSKA